MAIQLLDLPSEILAIVFRMLRGEGLNTTLTVSSTWKDIAEPVAYEFARLELLKRNRANEPWNMPAKSLELLQTHVQHLAILTPSYSVRDEVHPDDNFASRTMSDRYAWLCEALLPKLLRLKSFSIRRGPALPATTLHWIRLSPAGNDQYLRITMDKLLPVLRSLSTLQYLDFLGLDLRPKDVNTSRAHPSECCCGELSMRMKRVKTFYLRLPYICTNIFSAFQNDAASGSTYLQDCVINTSMGLDDDLVIEHATGCSSSMGPNKTVNPAYLQTEAREKVKWMPQIKRLRIVYHTYPLGNTQAYDAVKDKHFRISEQNWTEVGKEVKNDQVSDSELFDDVDVFDSDDNT